METGTNNVVHPTFSCFDDAMEFIEYVAKEHKQDDLSMIKLVHGLFTGNDNKSHTHAWVEDSSMEVAIFAGMWKGDKIYFYSPIDQFYSSHKITETTKYTLREAAEKNLTHQTFGPWEPKYVALCGDGHYETVGSGEMKLGTVGRLPNKEVHS
jgi:hypothetical protein